LDEVGDVYHEAPLLLVGRRGARPAGGSIFTTNLRRSASAACTAVRGAIAARAPLAVRSFNKDHRCPDALP
jgi:hypothetical protein